MKWGPGAGATVSLRANRYAGDRRWDTGDMAEKMYFIVPTRANDNDARSGDETLHQSLRVWGRNLTQISGCETPSTVPDADVHRCGDRQHCAFGHR
jgi:hypothetical protein